MRCLTVAAAALALLFARGPAAPELKVSAQSTAPVLGVDGTRLTVDGKPRFLVFISYFDGVRRVRSGADADVAFLAKHVDGIRVLPNWWASTCPVRSGEDTLIDLDGGIRASVWNDLKRLLDSASAHSLIVDVTFTRESVTDNATPSRVLSHEAYEAALVKLVGSRDYFKGRYPNVLIDVQNEWTRFASMAEIDRLLTRLREVDPSRILAASVSGEAYVPAGRRLPNMVAAYHDPRGRDWFTNEAVVRQVNGVRTMVGQPVYLQEPMPASRVCDGQIVDRDMTHFTQALDAARRSGAAAWTFHTRSTFDLSRQSFVDKLDAPAAKAEKQAIEQLGAVSHRDTETPRD